MIPFLRPVLTAVVSHTIILILFHASKSSKSFFIAENMSSAEPDSQTIIPKFNFLEGLCKQTTSYSLNDSLLPSKCRQKSFSRWRITFISAIFLLASLITPFHIPLCDGVGNSAAPSSARLVQTLDACLVDREYLVTRLAADLVLWYFFLFTSTCTSCQCTVVLIKQTLAGTRWTVVQQCRIPARQPLTVTYLNGLSWPLAQLKYLL